MIPPFNEVGVLPPTAGDQPYVCDRASLEQRFVVDMGEPAWRRVLFDGWDLLRQSIEVIVPSARWWLWGSLVTARERPLFGDLAVLDAAVIIPADELPTQAELGLLMATVRTAEELHRVDVHDAVFDVPADHPHRLVTDEALKKFRARGSRSIVDDSMERAVHAGFIEVLP